VYGTLLEQWLGAPSEQVLGKKFDQIGLIKQKLAADARSLAQAL
jgi:hypothetical protein